MRRLIVLIAVLWSCAVPSLASVWLDATCSAGQATVELGIANNYGDQFAGLIVTRYQWGTCEDPIVVTDLPIPLPPLGDGQQVNIVVPAPLANVFYLFEAKLVDAEGNQYAIAEEYNMGLHQIPHDLAADGSAVVMRGPMLLDDFGVSIAPCADGCWGDLTERYYFGSQAPVGSILWALAYVGEVADITGEILVPDGMLGPQYDIYVESWDFSPPGSCGVVATENSTWGGLKAKYR